MKPRLRSLLALSALFPLAACDRSAPSSSGMSPQESADQDKTQAELAEARDALQRQALEIETRSALMEKQLAEMEKAVKDQENASLRNSLEDLRRQNADLQAQAQETRRQSAAVAQRMAASSPSYSMPPPVTTGAPDYSLFYEQLSPYGRWLDVSGYGYCWRPTITTAGWRPYVDGSWSWSSLGWTWESNEPFGWAVYHYGRWVNLAGYGWVWVPGNDWAPAWVSWRQSRDYVGWAPLPPGPSYNGGIYRDCDSQYNLGPSSYVFITLNQFTQPSYTSYCAPVTRNTTIFQSSVNVTQIVRQDGPGRGREHVFVHHGGPPRAQIEKVCSAPVRQLKVQTVGVDRLPPAPHDRGPGQNREHRRDDAPPRSFREPVIVELPRASGGKPQFRPQVADRVERPQRLGGFEGVPQRDLGRIRQTLQEEQGPARMQKQQVAAETAVLTAPPAQSSDSRPEHNRWKERDRDHSATRNNEPRETSAPPSVPATPAVTPVVEKAAPQMPNQPEREQPGRRDREAGGTPMPGGIPANPAAVVETPAVNQEERPSTRPGGRQPGEEPERPRRNGRGDESPSTPVVAAPGENMTPPAVTERPERSRPGGRRGGQEEQGGPSEGAAMQQRQQEEAAAAQQRAAAEKMAAEQAQAQAAAEAEKTRLQQAEGAAMQQRQQEEATVAQQREAAEKMAAEQAQAAAEAEKVRQQQAEAAAMQQRQQQEMAQRQAEEQARREQEAQMRQQQEMAQRQAEEQARREQEAQMRQQQEMAQRQAEEQARREQEAQMRQQQEMAQRQAEEQARREQEAQMRQQQEMAQRQAEEQARRAQEAQMRQQQEMAQRQAEEQARREQEAQMRQQQEMAQRQAEEQARRAQEMAQRQAEEQARRAQEEAQRAAQEAARNQPQPAPGS